MEPGGEYSADISSQTRKWRSISGSCCGFTTWSGPMRQPLNILGALILKKVYCTVTRLPYFLSASSSILREEAEGDCAHSLTSLLSPCRGTCNVTLMWLRHKHDNKIHRNTGSYTIQVRHFEWFLVTQSLPWPQGCLTADGSSERPIKSVPFLVTSPAYQLFSNCKAGKQGTSCFDMVQNSTWLQPLLKRELQGSSCAYSPTTFRLSQKHRILSEAFKWNAHDILWEREVIIQNYLVRFLQEKVAI